MMMMMLSFKPEQGLVIPDILRLENQVWAVGQRWRKENVTIIYLPMMNDYKTKCQKKLSA